MDAEKEEKNIEATGMGEFKVKSSTGEHFYSVTYSEICSIDCRSMFCKICKICKHIYSCDCPNYAVRSNLCKHIHMVVMYEKARSDSVSGHSDGDYEENLCIAESSSIKTKQKEEILEFLETCETSENKDKATVDEDTERRIRLEVLSHFLQDKDYETFDKVMKGSETVMNSIAHKNRTGFKRKIEKQTFFPKQNKIPKVIDNDT